MALANLLIEQGRYDAEFVRDWTNGPLLVRSDTRRFLRAADLTGNPATHGFVVWDETAGAPEPYDTARMARRPERFALHGAYQVETPAGPVECRPAFAHYADACAAWPADRAARTTWIPEREIRALADTIAAASSVAYYGWTGVGQHANATQIDRAMSTLYALTGSYDTPGGNVPLSPLPFNGASDPGQFDPEQRAKALGLDKHPLGPPATGWINAGDLRRAIEHGDPYKVRALIGFGANLVVSQPGSEQTARSLTHLDFQVHIDMFHNPTSTTADIVLPVNSAWEHEALRFGFEVDQRAAEHVQLRPRMVEPMAGTRSDMEIVFDLAQRLGFGAQFFDGDIEAAWNHQLAPLGLTTGELRAQQGGVRVAQPVRHRKYAAPADAAEADGTPADAAQADGTPAVRGFDTPTRRVELYSERMAEHGYPAVPEHAEPSAPGPDHPLVLTCAKNGYFVHSQHRDIGSLRRRSPEPCVDISPETARARGIGEGQWVELATPRGSVRMRARFDDSLHPAVVVAEFGWWQGAPDLALPGADPLSRSGSNFNLLIDHTVTDPVSGSVPLRSSVCEITPAPADGAWAGTRPFTVTAVEPQGEGVRTLRMVPLDGGPLPDFRPGQHLTVRAENEDGTVADALHGRSYSLTGPAIDPGRRAYHLAVRHVPDGSFSTYVHESLKPGDRLHLATPGGGFALPTDTDAPVVLLAGGIGITPFMSYLETLAATGGSVPEVVLHYGIGNSADHPFRERIRTLAARIPALRIVTHYANPLPGDAVGEDYDRAGFISVDDIDPGLVERRARFYFCGPPPMIDALTAALRDRGVPRFEIFSEKFQAATREVTVPDGAEFTVRFARSGTELTWRKGDGTLLAAAEEAAVRLPSGCRVGQCESCAVPVLDGAVTHLVAPSEDLPEDNCLTCQSVPAADLVLDA
ncbi:molybdopterin dinucleotide binding domain-containing protein [Streptomyces sp. ISL-43]|uniref:molybdopterin dinucleotide binding domain-containing protein n=1 Tax=Streptomyces sp. ISL-43 TaxID=2819183 RepID=UPI0027E54F93|nr:molybdopterin dinucleotide binding domain-containing protein [Streptomyces sp. ISL-43]